MMGTKYVFMEKSGLLSLNYPCYSFLSGALGTMSHAKLLLHWLGIYYHVTFE